MGIFYDSQERTLRTREDAHSNRALTKQTYTLRRETGALVAGAGGLALKFGGISFIWRGGEERSLHAGGDNTKSKL